MEMTLPSVYKQLPLVLMFAMEKNLSQHDLINTLMYYRELIGTLYSRELLKVTSATKR